MKRTALKRKTPLRSKPKPRTKKPRPPMARCDDLAREINRRRARDRCEGRPGHECKRALQWAHIIGRDDHWVRHDEDNALLLCQAEHMHFTHQPTAWIVFIGEDRYFALHRRAAAGLRRKIDWRERERMLKIRLDQLGGADV